jgi:ABC-type sugar transport system substrate-binding protein
MLLSRMVFHACFVAFLLASFLRCGSAHDSDEYFVFVAANLQVPYLRAAGSGFSKAAEKVECATSSP